MSLIKCMSLEAPVNFPSYSAYYVRYHCVLQDYTGTYILELIPCTVQSTQKFTSNQSPILCTAKIPQRYGTIYRISEIYIPLRFCCCCKLLFYIDECINIDERVFNSVFYVLKSLISVHIERERKREKREGDFCHMPIFTLDLKFYCLCRFEIPIAFQQSNHPVPLVYSLDTSFQLTNNEEFFLMDIHDRKLKDEMVYDGVFEQGTYACTETPSH